MHPRKTEFWVLHNQDYQQSGHPGKHPDNKHLSLENSMGTKGDIPWSFYPFHSSIYLNHCRSASIKLISAVVRQMRSQGSDRRIPLQQGCREFHTGAKH